LAPTRSGTATWRSVAAGAGVSCGIQSNGTLWCWGSGFGTTPVSISSATTWTFVSATLDVFQGISSGTLYTWKASSPTPSAVGSETTWKSFSAGTYTSPPTGVHGCGLHTDGSLWCSGFNAEGQVGDGTTMDRATPVRIGTMSDWTKV